MTDTVSERPLYIPHAGTALLTTPLLNKGSAFTKAERIAFNLHGLLPPRYETIEEQAARCYRQFRSFDTPLNQHIYLRNIQDKNETLYYKLVQDHLEEMMPIIYTPTVGEACERFSDIYRSSRGLFISYPDREDLDDILHNATKRNVKVVVVTDGERILGLGDQGIGGMGIPIGKLTLYTVCGGISPAYTLPIMLDVGTNNEELLRDPMYMGWRHRRIGEEEYAEFMDLFMSALRRRWPNCMVQFEDFAQANATPLLERYRDRTCCFNDDIQGTAAVALGTLLAACRVKRENFTAQTFVFAGAGSAGCGIAEYVVRQLCADGLTEADARARIFMVDKCGLLTAASEGLRDFQARLAQPVAAMNELQLAPGEHDLATIIQRSGATVLVGVSGHPGLITEPAVAALRGNTQRPIIFPLSNPSKRIEADPGDLIRWTQGRAVVATGSPFDDIQYDGSLYPIAQCNNSYIFPGVGLAVVAAGIRRISDTMLIRASHVLAESSPAAQGTGTALLPPLTQIAELSRTMAFEIAKLAQAEGHALEMPDELLQNKINRAFWKPQYRAYRRVSI